MFRFILTTITLSSLFIVNSTALEPTDTLEPFEGKLRPLGVTPANLLEKRYCDGAPYSNTICCGAYYYCFDYEVCCDSYYCCPSGTTCLGGLLCSPYGNNNPPPAASTTVYTITEKPAVPSTTYVPYYSTYDFTITWYYWYYYYIYDYVIEASTVTSSYVTTHTFIYITATDSVAAQSSFSAYVFFEGQYGIGCCSDGVTDWGVGDFEWERSSSHGFINGWDGCSGGWRAGSCRCGGGFV
ncbi:hypothetical protein K432DRAFT_454276 [Lepidopterella palustris CBS 459.81]|uniref:Chitin-binding type-1 domain-containing protein n=1 Tax=Lepidopterella palustris CBS 459.81 TaxID=1314670 RepID=A0A8E2E9D7_9PEZI|nr:hypothetical protein K432DRAFT_454276 [Lepidopterella palustris CBS 459.81]